MWIGRSVYEYLKKQNDELIKENNELKPLPRYSIVFYEVGDRATSTEVRGYLSYDCNFVTFADKRYNTLAVFPKNRVLSVVEVKRED
jgi:hypothetical protein